MALTRIIPILVPMMVVGLWGRMLDRMHIVRFRSYHSWVFVVANLLMAGAFLAIGACMSATSKSQVVAFVLTTVTCFAILMAGYPLVQDALASWMPGVISETIAGLSFLTRFDAISKGVLSLADLAYFASLIGVALAINAVVVEMKKAV